MTDLASKNNIYADGGIYSTLRYASPWVQKGLRFARYIIHEKYETVLCVGCGNGYEVIEYLNQGKDAYGVELHSVKVDKLCGRIIIAKVPELPFRDKQFDLVHCTEVLEHIEPGLTDKFLKELLRVGKNQLISIATRGDPPYNTHINIQPSGFWIKMFIDLGYHIKEYKYRPRVNTQISEKKQVISKYGDGIFVHAGEDI